MNLKIILCAISLICFCAFAKGQVNIKFDYDDSGNRIQRIIDMNKSAIVDNNTEGNSEVITDQLEELQVNIYPNPTKGKIRLEIPMLDKNAEGRIKVIDASGKNVFQDDHLSVSNLINIEKLNNGIYFLHLFYNEQSLQWKIIKQ